jgi:hypothetical protein
MQVCVHVCVYVWDSLWNLRFILYWYSKPPKLISLHLIAVKIQIICYFIPYMEQRMSFKQAFGELQPEQVSK